MSTVLPDPRSGSSLLRPPQFGLRTLLVAMTALSVLFALMALAGAAWSLSFGFLLALVAAHVIGNALGHNLRAQTDAQCAAEQRPIGPLVAAGHGVAPARRLTEKAHLGRQVRFFSIAGALAGACIGGLGLAYITWEQATPASLALGTVSFAVLGVFLGFMASSCWSTVRAAWHEAIGKPDR